MAGCLHLAVWLQCLCEELHEEFYSGLRDTTYPTYVNY